MDAQSAADPEVARSKPLALKTLLFYGSGQSGAQLCRDAPASLLPLFMATMLGVSPWLAGVVILVPKLWVIVCDPLMGALSDHFKPRFGRRPFLVAGGVVTATSFVGLFAFSDFSSPAVAALTVGVMYFISSTAFSAFSVPYLAVASELSTDPHERTKILAVRMIFSIVGVIMGVGLAQPLVFMLGGDAAAWRTMAMIFGAVCLLAMLITAYGVPRDFGAARNAVRAVVTDGIERVAPKTTLQRFLGVRHNKPFMILTLTSLIQTIAQGSGYAVVGFIFIYAIGDISLLLPFVLSMAVGVVISQAFWVKLSTRIGKQSTFYLACSGWILITLTWFAVGPADDVLLTLPLWGDLPTQHALVLGRGMVIGITNSGFSLLTFSLFTDTVSFQREQTGAVDEGILAGIFSATEKLAFALGPLLAGIVLSVVGFESSTDGPAPQSAQAIQGMIWLYSIIPAGILALSLAVFAQYNKALKTGIRAS
ncbi:MAG: MFS transporter [Congregibacter sp.]